MSPPGSEACERDHNTKPTAEPRPPRPDGLARSAAFGAHGRSRWADLDVALAAYLVPSLSKGINRSPLDRVGEDLLHDGDVVGEANGGV